MTISLIIVTIGRPDCVRKCLAALRLQTRSVEQVIVVDGSNDDCTREVVAKFPEVAYVRNENGFGRMTASRNIGMMHATGDVIAFIDDDAYAHPQWTEEILRPYADASVGAVGGQALNGQPGETQRGKDRVGRFTRSGQVTGNFAADTGSVIEVDHLIGCNMSFRREAIGLLGGFHEFYPGFCSTYEEADLCLRLKQSRWRILYNPRATVDHEGAPRTVGKRFNLPYLFRVNRNHATMIVRNYGLTGSLTVLYVATVLGGQVAEVARKTAGAVVRATATGLGVLVGLVGGVPQRLREGRSLVREDETGRQLRAWLSQPSAESNEQQSDEEPVAVVTTDGEATA